MRKWRALRCGGVGVTAACTASLRENLWPWVNRCAVCYEYDWPIQYGFLKRLVLVLLEDGCVLRGTLLPEDGDSLKTDKNFQVHRQCMQAR